MPSRMLLISTIAARRASGLGAQVWQVLATACFVQALLLCTCQYVGVSHLLEIHVSLRSRKIRLAEPTVTRTSQRENSGRGKGRLLSN